MKIQQDIMQEQLANSLKLVIEKLAGNPSEEVNQQYPILGNRDIDAICKGLMSDQFDYQQLPHIVNNNGSNLLHIASNIKEPLAVKFLITKGLDLNIANNSGVSAVHIATANNSKEIVGLLLENGAYADVLDAQGKTPLHYACQENYADIAQLMIYHNAHVDAVDNEGMTPLHYACQEDYADIAQLLICNGANIEIKNTDQGLAADLLEEGSQIHGFITNQNTMLQEKKAFNRKTPWLLADDVANLRTKDGITEGLQEYCYDVKNFKKLSIQELLAVIEELNNYIKPVAGSSNAREALNPFQMRASIILNLARNALETRIGNPNTPKFNNFVLDKHGPLIDKKLAGDGLTDLHLKNRLNQYDSYVFKIFGIENANKHNYDGLREFRKFSDEVNKALTDANASINFEGLDNIRADINEYITKHTVFKEKFNVVIGEYRTYFEPAFDKEPSSDVLVTISSRLKAEIGQEVIDRYIEKNDDLKTQSDSLKDRKAELDSMLTSIETDQKNIHEENNRLNAKQEELRVKGEELHAEGVKLNDEKQQSLDQNNDKIGNIRALINQQSQTINSKLTNLSNFYKAIFPDAASTMENINDPKELKNAISDSFESKHNNNKASAKAIAEIENYILNVKKEHNKADTYKDVVMEIFGDCGFDPLFITKCEGIQNVSKQFKVDISAAIFQGGIDSALRGLETDFKNCDKLDTQISNLGKQADEIDQKYQTLIESNNAEIQAHNQKVEANQNSIKENKQKSVNLQQTAVLYAQEVETYKQNNQKFDERSKGEFRSWLEDYKDKFDALAQEAIMAGAGKKLKIAQMLVSSWAYQEADGNKNHDLDPHRKEIKDAVPKTASLIKAMCVGDNIIIKPAVITQIAPIYVAPAEKENKLLLFEQIKAKSFNRQARKNSPFLVKPVRPPLSPNIDHIPLDQTMSSDEIELSLGSTIRSNVSQKVGEIRPGDDDQKITSQTQSLPSSPRSDHESQHGGILFSQSLTIPPNRKPEIIRPKSAPAALGGGLGSQSLSTASNFFDIINGSSLSHQSSFHSSTSSIHDEEQSQHTPIDDGKSLHTPSLSSTGSGTPTSTLLKDDDNMSTITDASDYGLSLRPTKKIKGDEPGSEQSSPISTASSSLTSFHNVIIRNRKGVLPNPLAVTNMMQNSNLDTSSVFFPPPPPSRPLSKQGSRSSRLSSDDEETTITSYNNGEDDDSLASNTPQPSPSPSSTSSITSLSTTLRDDMTTISDITMDGFENTHASSVVDSTFKIPRPRKKTPSKDDDTEHEDIDSTTVVSKHSENDDQSSKKDEASYLKPGNLPAPKAPINNVKPAVKPTVNPPYYNDRNQRPNMPPVPLHPNYNPNISRVQPRHVKSWTESMSFNPLLLLLLLLFLLFAPHAFIIPVVAVLIGAGVVAADVSMKERAQLEQIREDARHADLMNRKTIEQYKNRMNDVIPNAPFKNINPHSYTDEQLKYVNQQALPYRNQNQRNINGRY